MENTITPNIIKNFDLAKATTFRIGGPAKYYAEAKNFDELKKLYSWANKNNEICFLLGGGSNILVSDEGFKGLVIRLKNNGINALGEVIECDAGASLSSLVNYAYEKGLSGLEWAIGIPGTVGGAVRGNAGAFGGTIASSIKNVEIIEKKSLAKKNLDKSSCQFEYRESCFKHNDDLIIWKVFFNLIGSSSDKIKKHQDEFIRRRRKIQPPFPSAGSIFKNLTFEELVRNNSAYAQKAIADKVVKGGMVGAGWVIQQLGLKGKKIGGAMISEEHANFIVNEDSAKAEDVVMLISLIKQQVRDKVGIQLNEEIMYVGF